MHISRRRFLKQSIKGATIVTGIGLSGLTKAIANDDFVPSAETNSSPAQSIQPARIDESASVILPKIKGQIVSAIDSSYNESRKNYNGRFDIKPKYIFYCESENDIIQAIKWAKEQKLKVSIRSGGHSYEAFSLIQDGIVIDLSKMRNVHVDLSKKLAVVDAGTGLVPSVVEKFGDPL